MSSKFSSIVWLRNDLRLSDNPALTAAAQRGAPVTVVYVFDDGAAKHWRLGGASRWWLHHSLAALEEDIARMGGQLILRRGNAHDCIRELAADAGADRVFWNRRYEPWAIEVDTKLKAALGDDGIEVQSFNGSLSVEPWNVSTKQNKPYRVFTPFWKSIKANHRPPKALPRPGSIKFAKATKSDQLEEWALLPTKPDWSGGLSENWTPGEHAAQGRLHAFVKLGLSGYDTARNIPAETGTSRLSPHLRFGEVSPRQVWDAVFEVADLRNPDAESFLSEIAWRDFSYNLLYHFPTLPDENFQSRFDAFEWTGTNEQLVAWQKGQTGYPIVDAGMRQLWHTGWMHNRVRMIVGSFLIKDLMIHWREGEAWFWDTLVDADLASNAAGWQWVAGSGADAAPYFRIFNPVSQGEKFDPEGEYVRNWVPEIRNLPKRVIHAPWTADRQTLSSAGIVLGRDYPEPIVDHSKARKAALTAFEKIKDAA